MEQELFKVIYKMEGDNKELLASLDQVNSKFVDQNKELDKQKVHLKTLSEREAELLRGRAQAQNPTAVVKYNKALEENKKKIDEVKKSMENLTVAEKETGKATEDLNKKMEKAFDGTKANSLKAQLRQLKEQLAKTDDDQEFLKLSVEAGKLEDKIQDARQAAQIFATDSPFQAVGNGIRGVAGDLLSLDFNGAAQKSKLLVQASKQITFKEAMTGIKDLGTTLLNVGKSLLTNPIFLIGAVVTAVIANFDALRNSGGLVGKVFTFIGDTVSILIKLFTDLTDKIGLTEIAASDAIQRAKKFWQETQDFYITSINNRYNAEIAKAKAAGKEVVGLEIEKRKAMIETYNQAIATQNKLVDGSEKSIRRFQTFQREAAGKIGQLNSEIELLQIEHNTKLEAEEKRASEARIKQMQDFLAKRAEDEQYYADLRLQIEQRENEEKIADQVKTAQEFKKKNEEFDKDEDKTRAEELAKFKNHLREVKEAQEKADAEAAAARKQQVQQQLDGIQTVTNAAINASSAILGNEISRIEKLTSVQQKRVDDAKAIADKGNAEQLELEQKRLEDLNQKREQFVRRQQQLASIELVANTAVAVSKAAAQGGAAAAFTITAALLALVAGLATARGIASQAAFYEGGFTGDGDPKQVSTALGNKPYTYHKGEFVMDHKKTAKYRDIFEGIHAGQIDLHDWKNKVMAFEALKGGSQAYDFDLSTLEKRLDKLSNIVQNQTTAVNFDGNGMSLYLKGIRTRDEFIKKRLGRL